MWLGIDFGTCFSSAAYLNKKGFPAPVKFGANKTSLPSSVYANEQGTLLVGFTAENSYQRNPFRYRREFKRQLGESVPLQMGDRGYLPEELVAEVLRKLKNEAEKSQEEVTSAVITVPASYQRNKRKVMEKAAKKAGFSEVKLLEEPIAAAIYHASQGIEPRDGEVVLVYDLGGGTFDAALIKYEKGEFKPLARSMGHERLGGSDFDLEIFRDLQQKCAQLRDSLNKETSGNPNEEMARRRMELVAKDLCRRLKEDLSDAEAEAVSDVLPTGEEYNLRRRDFNRMIEAMIKETCDICQNLVNDAKLKWKDIDNVLLVGGSCRIPYVQKAVKRAFGRPVRHVSEPELAVCFGAAIYAERNRKPTRKSDKGKEDEASMALQLANELFDKDEYEQAKQQYVKVIQLKPPFVYQAHSKRGLIYLEQGQYGQAVKNFNRALELEPSYAEAYYGLGRVNYDRQRFAEAIDQIKLAIRYDPQFTLAHALLGMIYSTQGKYSQAVKHFEQAMKLDKRLAEAYHGLGSAYLMLDNLQMAKKQLSNLQNLDEKLAGDLRQAILTKEGALQKYQEDEKKRKEEERKQLEQQRNFQDAVAQYDLGVRYHDQRNYTEAEARFLGSIRSNPNYAEAYNELGRVYLDQQQYDKAAEQFRQAVRLSPNWAAIAHNNLGWAYYNQKRHAEAIKQYKQAILLDPKYPTAYVNLGLAYIAVGNKDEAIKQYQMLQGLDAKLAENLLREINNKWSPDRDELGWLAWIGIFIFFGITISILISLGFSKGEAKCLGILIFIFFVLIIFFAKELWNKIS